MRITVKQFYDDGSIRDANLVLPSGDTARINTIWAAKKHGNFMIRAGGQTYERPASANIVEVQGAENATG